MVATLNFQQFLKLIKTSFLSLFLLSFSFPAWSELTIEINEGYENAYPIAIVPFGFSAVSDDPKAKSANQPVDLASIIAADLRRSGHFNPIASSKMPAIPHEPQDINYSDWRPLDVDNMLIGRLVHEGNGLYQIDMRFMDVLRKKQLIGKRWTGVKKQNLRRVAHQISDLIYEELTGVRGAFNTQIAYVTLRKPARNVYTPLKCRC